MSDFCGGFWAQVFGPPYNQLLVPFLKVHFACRILLVLALLGLLLRVYLQYRPRQLREASPESEDSGGFPETSLSPSGT